MILEHQSIKFIVDTWGAQFLIIPKGFSKEELVKQLEDKQQVFIHYPKVRVIFDDDSLSDTIYQFLQELSVKNAISLRINPYATNFFKIKKDHAQDHLSQYDHSNWQNWSSQFQYTLIKPEDQKGMEIVKQFAFDSYGVDFVKQGDQTITTINPSKREKILKYFDQAISDPDCRTFLVRSSNQLVGSYSLVRVYQDVQLYGVAGRIDSPEAFTGGKRLPILMSSMLDIICTDPFFKDWQQFTFSNSKDAVASAYRGLGFQPNSERVGLVVEREV